MTIETLAAPTIAIRGRSFMAIVLAPSLPLGEWFAALDAQLQRAAGFFADKPVIVNLAAMLGGEDQPEEVLEALDERGLSLIGIEGIEPAELAGTRWEKLTRMGGWRQTAQAGKPDRALAVPDDPIPATAPKPPAPPPAESLLIDRPVRSGQSIIFEEGDITILGSVASGAEVIAGGSIHVYGPLRGRAIAGFRTGATARIFCQKLLAELISIDGLYYAPEHWSDGFHGKAVQIRLQAGALKFALLD